MSSVLYQDPYAGNILTQPLGPILSREEVIRALEYMPPMPSNVTDIPKHIRLHYLANLRDLHIPSLEGIRVHTTVDLMTRQSYRFRDPKLPKTWQSISGEPSVKMPPIPPASMAMVAGLPGDGKTQAILHCLQTYPSQVIVHDSFPQIAGKQIQVVWLSVDVPASGRMEDLAANLMMAWDRATGGNRFASSLLRKKRDGIQMLDEFIQVAASHWLGILHFDEIQNFFKISTLERRRKAKAGKEGMELSIIEDACLKGVLNFSNRWQIPMLFSGTPDGVGALTKRFATSQRLSGEGYHPIPSFTSGQDPTFEAIFFPRLCEYQFVKVPLQPSVAFRNLIFELSGGIRRIIIMLWVAAHRVAFERKADDLRLSDFETASRTYLALLGPAIAALRSDDPLRMARYEDLMPRDDDFWTSFWTGMRG